MKQPKVIDPPISSPVPEPILGPRYRYFLKPPATVSLRAGDLLAEVPDSGRAKGFVAERVIELPAEEIFRGPVPRISLDSLSEIAPECFHSNGFQTFIRLPASKLALGYHLVQERELLPDERPAYTPPPEEELAPTAEELSPTEEEVPVEEPIAQAAPEPKETQRLTPLRVHESAAPVATPAPQVVSPALIPYPVPAPAPVASPIAAPFRSPAMLPKVPAPIRPTVASDAQAPDVPAPGVVPSPKKVFSVLPLFRRKAPVAEVPPVVEAPPAAENPVRRRIELPPPRATPGPVKTSAPVNPSEEILLPPVEDIQAEPEYLPQEFATPEPIHEEPVYQHPAHEEPVAEYPETPVESDESVVPELKSEPVHQAKPVDQPEPPAPVEEVSLPVVEEPFVAQEVPPVPPPQPTPAPAVMMETEHLPKLSSKLVEQHDDLQALFMTEESLSVERVVELCGGLPGINSCVLSHGAAVIASHNVPDTFDLISLSAHALDMLRAMRESSARMGVGAIPAVTLHSEKGPITFFHREDLCLLILHKDRGFVPGVREKLQRVVDELSRARLPKPLPSKPRTLPAE